MCPGGQGGSIASAWTGSGDGHGFIWNFVFEFEFLTFGFRVLLSFLVSGTLICWDLDGDEVGKGNWEQKTAWNKEKEKKNLV